MLTPKLGMSARGITEFYSLLWKKDENGEAAPGICVPDTVTFKKHSSPQWYFSSVQERMILRKSSKNTTMENIEDAFCKKPKMEPGRLPCDIVAYYITDQEGPDGSSVASIEYFDEEGLHNFLFSRVGSHLRDGVLQKFMEPSGLNNSIIRAVWTPKVCVIERRMNNRRMSERKFDMYQRAATYEGDEHLSTYYPVSGSLLASQVEKQCDTIARHLEKSFGGELVSKLVVNFKLDHAEKLWVLWCSTVKAAKPTVPKTLSEPNLTTASSSSTSQQTQRLPPFPATRDTALRSRTTISRPVSSLGFQLNSARSGGATSRAGSNPNLGLNLGGLPASSTAGQTGGGGDKAPNSPRLSARGPKSKCPSCKRNFGESTRSDVMYRTAILRYLKQLGPKMLKAANASLTASSAAAAAAATFDALEERDVDPLLNPSKGPTPGSPKKGSAQFDPFASLASVASGFRASVAKSMVGIASACQAISANQRGSISGESIGDLPPVGDDLVGGVSSMIRRGSGLAGGLTVTVFAGEGAMAAAAAAAAASANEGMIALSDGFVVEEWKVELYRKFFKMKPLTGRYVTGLMVDPEIERTFWDSMPPVLRVLEPNLSPEKYAQKRDDPLFQYKTFQVCEECGLLFMKSAEEDSIFLANLSDEFQDHTGLTPRKFKLSKRIEELAQFKPKNDENQKDVSTEIFTGRFGSTSATPKSAASRPSTVQGSSSSRMRGALKSADKIRRRGISSAPASRFDLEEDSQDTLFLAQEYGKRAQNMELSAADSAYSSSSSKNIVRENESAFRDGDFQKFLASLRETSISPQSRPKSQSVSGPSPSPAQKQSQPQQRRQRPSSTMDKPRTTHTPQSTRAKPRPQSSTSKISKSNFVKTSGGGVGGGGLTLLPGSSSVYVEEIPAVRIRTRPATVSGFTRNRKSAPSPKVSLTPSPDSRGEMENENEIDEIYSNDGDGDVGDHYGGGGGGEKRLNWSSNLATEFDEFPEESGGDDWSARRGEEEEEENLLELEEQGQGVRYELSQVDPLGLLMERPKFATTTEYEDDLLHLDWKLPVAMATALHATTRPEYPSDTESERSQGLYEGSFSSSPLTTNASSGFTMPAIAEPSFAPSLSKPPRAPRPAPSGSGNSGFLPNIQTRPNQNFEDD